MIEENLESVLAHKDDAAAWGLTMVSRALKIMDGPVVESPEELERIYLKVVSGGPFAVLVMLNDAVEDLREFINEATSPNGEEADRGKLELDAELLQIAPMCIYLLGFEQLMKRQSGKENL